jgi:hypothetical protein
MWFNHAKRQASSSLRQRIRACVQDRFFGRQDQSPLLRKLWLHGTLSTGNQYTLAGKHLPIMQVSVILKLRCKAFLYHAHVNWKCTFYPDQFKCRLLSVYPAKYRKSTKNHHGMEKVAQLVHMYILQKAFAQTSISYIAIFLAEGMNQKSFPRGF